MKNKEKLRNRHRSEEAKWHDGQTQHDIWEQYILYLYSVPYIMLCLAQGKNGFKEKNLSGLKLA